MSIIMPTAPPSPCRSWFYQCCVYVGIIVIEKVVITLVTLFQFWKEVGAAAADDDDVVVMKMMNIVVEISDDACFSDDDDDDEYRN